MRSEGLSDSSAEEAKPNRACLRRIDFLGFEQGNENGLNPTLREEGLIAI